MPNENFRDADSRDASPETIALTIEAMGIDVDRYAGHPALDLIAYDVKAGLESGLSPSSDILRIIQDYVDFHGTGDKVLDTLQVIENLEVLENDEVYHRFPEGFDIKAFENPWAGAAAAAIAGADLSDGFDGSIDSIPIMDCIDTGKLSDLLIERGCGAVDKDGWVTRAGKDYETAAGALAACGIPEMAADIDSAMGLELGGDATARAYIEERLSIDGLDDIIESSSTESVAALAYALTMVSDEEAHGIDLYCKAAGPDIDGAAGIACVAATMAKLGAEEFGYAPCRGIEGRERPARRVGAGHIPGRSPGPRRRRASPPREHSPRPVRRQELQRASIAGASVLRGGQPLDHRGRGRDHCADRRPGEKLLRNSSGSRGHARGGFDVARLGRRA